MENSGLEDSDIEKIRKVFSNYPKIELVLLYGSRAKENYKTYSDIDLSLKGEDLDLTLLQAIEFEIDDLLLPFKFDISIYDGITNPDFKEHIDRVGKVFYSRK